MKTLICDVLVVGGAGAAVLSALSAARAGADVLLVSKGKVGKSGNTIMIGGSFGIDGPSAAKYCGEPEANPDYTAEALYEKLVSSGFQLGDRLLQRQFVEDGPAAVSEVLRWARETGQVFQFMPSASRWRTSGVAFGRAIRHGLTTEPRVRVLEDMLVSDLLTAGGTVCGALATDVYTGESVALHARAVVLATGGWQPFSLQNSMSDMTGDGIAMALRAGASAIDMEFLLFIGTIVEPQYARGSLLPYLLTIPTLFPLRAQMTDLDGEELPFSPDPRFKTSASSSKVKKLLMAYFYGKGIYEKWDRHGNRFYYDYSRYSEQEIRDAFAAFAKAQSAWNGAGRYHSIDLRRLAEEIIANGKRLMVGFGNEYSMGGIRIDEHFSAGVPGLFAAGEVTGGVFGAFRSGDGLTEMLAHGLRAGASAAAFARNAPQREPDNTDEALAQLTAPLRDGGLAPSDARRRLTDICDRGFNFWRDGGRLETAYHEIHRLREDLGRMAAGTERRYNLEWMESVAVRSLALCAEAGIYAALKREESRGCHLRADHPEVDDDRFCLSYTARLEGDTLCYGELRPETTAGGCSPNVAEYIAEHVLGVKKCALPLNATAE